ncbi:MAG: hypothetical protein KatS3mg102_1392 [Planctomycetota bacterium]|nr:MAG: hypothetical protein KatS3mg102_1392 [Planctomycetota bacterium]
MRWRVACGAAFAAAMALSGLACSDSDVKVSDIPGKTTFKVRVIGRTVDQQTQSGVKARITACELGASTTANSSGFFELEITDIDAGTDQICFTLLIEAGGFATCARQVCVDFSDLDDLFDDTSEDTSAWPLLAGQTFIVDLDQQGVIELRRPQNLTVVVTKEGAPLANAHVFAQLCEDTVVVLDNFAAFAAASSGASTQACDSEDLEDDDAGLLTANGCLPRLVARTDRNGIATIQGLDAHKSYCVVVPSQDLDGTPGWDFGSAGIDGHVIVACGDVVAIDVRSLHGSPFVEEIAKNAPLFPDIGDLSDGGYGYGYSGLIEPSAGYSVSTPEDEGWFMRRAITTQDGSVTVVFRYPVEILTNDPNTTGLEPRFEYFRDLVPDSDPDQFELITISATAAPLAGSLNTIWTITPSEPLPANEIFALRYFARAVGGDPLALDSVVNVENCGLYRPVLEGSLAPPVADNYNRFTASSVTLGAVYLDFAEAVTGRYKVLEVVNDTAIGSFPNGGIVFQSTGPANEFWGFLNDCAPPSEDNLVPSSDVSFVHNAETANSAGSGGLGTQSGTRFRVLLRAPDFSQLSLPDDTPGAPVRVKVALDVRDAEGNALNAILDLPVK